MIAEGACLDDTPHTTGAFTGKQEVSVASSSCRLEAARRASPEVFYRVVAGVSQGISMRFRYTSEQLAETAGAEQLIGSVRRENDLLGEREVPNTAYYGVKPSAPWKTFPSPSSP